MRGSTEKTDQPNPEITLLDYFKAHKARCVADFLLCLSQLKTQNTMLYPALLENIIVISKYKHLSLMRKQLLQTLTLELDHQIKRHIYSQPMLDLAPYLNLWDIDLLTCPITEAKLTEIKQACYQAIKTEEILFQEQDNARDASLKAYVQYHAFQAGTFIYQHSFLGLGAAFFEWIGKLIIKPSIINQFLNQNAVLQLFKITGMILAIIYTYAAGLFQLMRLLMISQLARTVNQQFANGVIDDKRAMIHHKRLPYHIKLTQSACFRITVLFVAAGEAMIFQNTEPCIRTAYGLSASLMVTTLAQYFIKDLRVLPNEALTQDQAFTLFLLSSFGYHLGQNIRGTIYTRIQSRLEIITEFQKQVDRKTIADLRFNNPSLLTSALSIDTLRVEWRNLRDQFFYRTHCNLGTKICEQPVQGLRRL